MSDPDILAELKNWKDERDYPTPGEMMDRAVAEITRLRDEVERLRASTTNHDAAPATTAAELARSPGQSPRGTGGTTPKPVLWLVENSHGVVVDLFDNAANAQRQVDRFNIERLRLEYHAVPLYRDPPPPTLTDAERTLIEKLTWPHPDPRMGRPLFVTPDERDIAVALLAKHGGDA